MAATPDSGLEVRLTLLLGAMAFAVFAILTALGMLGPLLVDMAADLETTVPVVAQLVTAAALAWAATSLVIGPFSDVYGRKPILILGLVLAGLGSIGTALAGDLLVASGFRVVAGVGGGMVPPSCIALVGDLFPPRRRAIR